MTAPSAIIQVDVSPDIGVEENMTFKTRPSREVFTCLIRFLQCVADGKAISAPLATLEDGAEGIRLAEKILSS